ncbi:MAG TPA: hypothetical protein VGN01_19110, partial [Acidobacteriaceae bacterium]
MPFRTYVRRPLAFAFAALFIVFVSLAAVSARAQDDDNPKPEEHGRKYKAPPDTSHIEVTVLKGFNKKPIDGAHVVLHPVKDGKDEGNLEIKTHQDGKAVIDVIPTGSKVRIQVLADGFATFADDYLVTEASRQITIEMARPQEQISAYVDNKGKASQMAPGVQVPIRPAKKKATPPASAA